MAQANKLGPADSTEIWIIPFLFIFYSYAPNACNSGQLKAGPVACAG